MWKNILSYFWELTERKRTNRTKYSLSLMLTLQLLWIMSWRTTERWICRFVEDNEEELLKELSIKEKSLPKRSTIRDALKQINYEEVSLKFIEWSSQYTEIKKDDWISWDWKTIRWSSKWENNSSQQNFLSLVSFFVWRSKQVVWAWKIETKKESEIPKVKELIKLLWLEWAIFTLDALHCQKDTVETIIETKNNYVIWVKWNQPKLKKEIKKTSIND